MGQCVECVNAVLRGGGPLRYARSWCCPTGAGVLAARLTELLGDADNRSRLGLQPPFDTLAQTENPEAIIGWARPSAKGTAHLILSRFGRGEIPLSHDALDALNTPGNGRTATISTPILTAIGALPPRDLELARLEQAIPVALANVSDEDQRKILRGCAAWDLLRRACAASRTNPLTAAARHSATERLAAATHLLDWLHGRALDLASCRQPDLDAYQVEHPVRAHNLYGFLAWAYRTRRARRLTLASRPKPLPRTVAAGDEHRWALAHALIHDDAYTPADRVAGLLVLLFGQRPHRISRLTTNDVTIDGDHMSITLGASPIELPEPLASHVNTLIATRRARVAKRVANPGPWLFPSQHPDRPALPEPSLLRAATRAYDAALDQLIGQSGLAA